MTYEIRNIKTGEVLTYVSQSKASTDPRWRAERALKNANANGVKYEIVEVK